MELFIDTIKKDSQFYYEKHNQWLLLRDSIIRECYEKNIDWNKVKDAFLFNNENAINYLIDKCEKEYYDKLVTFFEKEIPSDTIEITCRPVNLNNKISKNTKRYWKYKNLEIKASLNELEKIFVLQVITKNLIDKKYLQIQMSLMNYS
jgi:hypothetical protein